MLFCSLNQFSARGEARQFLGLSWLAAKWNNWLRSISSSCQSVNKDIPPIGPEIHCSESRSRPGAGFKPHLCLAGQFESPVSSSDPSRRSGYESLMRWLQQILELSLTSEQAVLAAGSSPQNSPPSILSDVIAEQFKRNASPPLKMINVRK